jgi:hypothetical protein
MSNDVFIEEDGKFENSLPSIGCSVHAKKEKLKRDNGNW